MGFVRRVERCRGVAVAPGAWVPGEPTATVAVRPALELVRDELDDEPQDGLVSLWQASVDKGDAWVPLRYDHLRKAAERGGEFPEPTQVRGRKRLYTPESLQRWAANREQAEGDVR